MERIKSARLVALGLVWGLTWVSACGGEVTGSAGNRDGGDRTPGTGGNTPGEGEGEPLCSSSNATCSTNLPCALAGEVCVDGKCVLASCAGLEGEGSEGEGAEGEGEGSEGEGVEGEGSEGEGVEGEGSEGEGVEGEGALCEFAARCADEETLEECDPLTGEITPLDCGAIQQVCFEGACRVCLPGSATCIDNVTTAACGTDGYSWVPTMCGPQKRCNPATSACEDAACTPGAATCKDAETLVECNADGTQETEKKCKDQGPSMVCQGNACLDLCANAAATHSYLGCEYWPVVLSNSQLNEYFHDEFAVVIANSDSQLTAHVQVTKWGSAGPQQVLTDEVPPASTKIIKLPWNSTNVVSGSGAVTTPVSTKARNAYKLTTDVPVAAYQFNPLKSAKATPPPGGLESDRFTYTNDASLLLPAHIYSGTYVGSSYPYQTLSGIYLFFTPVEMSSPTYLSIVATAAGTTTVDVTFKGYAAAGAGVTAAKDPNQTGSYSLEQYEVLTLTTRKGGPSSCLPNPPQPSCGQFSDCSYCTYPDADLTGTIIRATQPIAVYGGADCSFVPFNEWACDHMEEQLFPFQNWGTTYVGTRSKPVGNQQGKDLWRVVAGVDGTIVTMDPTITGVPNPFTLNAGGRRQFFTDQNFVIMSQDVDHPILVAQFMPGQNVSFSDLEEGVGDPSMILAAPVEQFRANYLFLTPDTIAQDYANIIRPAGAKVMLNGQQVSDASFKAIGNSAYEVATVTVPDNQSTITADKPVGLIVYGYDRYVSYGYLGGLDLRSITVIQPGG